MSFIKSTHHIVFSTKYREETINIENERELYAYIMGIINNLGGFLYRIGGMPDHIHILVDVPATKSLSDFVKTIKQSSSLWMKNNTKFPKWRGWEDGYGAFSYSKNELQNVVEYIKSQKEHHKRFSFIEEYRAWLIEMGISQDVPYFPK